MISAEDARRIAEEWLLRHVPDADGNEIVLKGECREEPFGWVFFYNTRRFLEEGDWSYALIGNAPVVVLRASGEVRPTGTALPLDHYLQEYRDQAEGDRADRFVWKASDIEIAPPREEPPSGG